MLCHTFEEKWNKEHFKYLTTFPSLAGLCETQINKITPRSLKLTLNLVVQKHLRNVVCICNKLVKEALAFKLKTHN